jgi:hypothetical protein
MAAPQRRTDPMTVPTLHRVAASVVGAVRAINTWSHRPVFDRREISLSRAIGRLSYVAIERPLR